MKMLRWLVVVSLVLLCGCAINTRQLKEGMTMRDIEGRLSAPAATYAGTIGGSKIDVWDFQKEMLYIPNVLDDYWSLVPPSTSVARLWFLNGALRHWQSAKCSGYQAVCTLKAGDDWSVPPDFDSPVAPQFIRELKRGGR
ncbi:MAG: hypothetical protein NT045_01955 [Candidatus Aureabacteria bacterium]|nr:hypothetical protein [Candidatus Auribacterota bacterium]